MVFGIQGVQFGGSRHRGRTTPDDIMVAAPPAAMPPTTSSI